MPAKTFTFYKQKGTNDCGLACLRMVCRHHGINQTFNTHQYHQKVTPSGLSLLALKELAAEAGFECMAQKCTIDELKHIRELPGIALLQGRHYVVVYEITAEQVKIADPATGQKEFSHHEFKEHWCDSATGEGVFVLLTKRQ